MNGTESFSQGEGATFGEYATTTKVNGVESRFTPSVDAIPSATKELGEYQTVTNEIGMDSQISGGEVLGEMTTSTNAGGLNTQIGSSYDVLKATSQAGGDVQFGEYRTTTKINGVDSAYMPSVDAKNSAEVVDTNVFSTSNSNGFQGTTQSFQSFNANTMTTTQGADNLVSGFADSAQSMQVNAASTNAMVGSQDYLKSAQTNVQTTFSETNTTTTFDNNAQGFDVNAFATSSSQENASAFNTPNAFQSTNAGIDITSNLQSVNTNSILNTVEANKFATSSQSFDTLPYIGPATDANAGTENAGSFVNTTTTTTETNASYFPSSVENTATVQNSQVNAYQFGGSTNFQTNTSNNEVRTSLVAEKQELQNVLETLDKARKSLEHIIKIGETLNLNASNTFQASSSANFQTTATSYENKVVDTTNFQTETTNNYPAIQTSSTIQTADAMSYQKAEPNIETAAPFDIASLTTSSPAVQGTTFDTAAFNTSSTVNTFDASAYQTTNLDVKPVMETTPKTDATAGFDFTTTTQTVQSTPTFDLSSLPQATTETTGATGFDFTSTTQTTTTETTGTTGFDFAATTQSVEPTPAFDLSSLPQATTATTGTTGFDFTATTQTVDATPAFDLGQATTETTGTTGFDFAR